MKKVLREKRKKRHIYIYIQKCGICVEKIHMCRKSPITGEWIYGIT